MSLSTVCNNDCTCINCDCVYAHPISFKERKIVNKLILKQEKQIVQMVKYVSKKLVDIVIVFHFLTELS